MTHRLLNHATGRFFSVSSRFPDGYVSVVLPDADEPEDPLVAMDGLGLELPVVSEVSGTQDPVLELIAQEEGRWDAEVPKPSYARFLDHTPRESSSVGNDSLGVAIPASPVKARLGRKLGAGHKPSQRRSNKALHMFVE